MTTKNEKEDKVYVPRDMAMYAMQKFQLEKLVLKSLQESNSSKFVKNYTRDNITSYLDNPERYEKELREISRILYGKSSHYRRTINYFSTILTFDYLIEPSGMEEKTFKNVDKLKKQFAKVSNFVEVLNLKHEFQKIALVAFKEDTFYGYEHYDKTDFFIQQLDPEYCKVSSIQEGVYNFAFNFSYFDKEKDKLDYFPSEFLQKYNAFKKDSKLEWQELDATKTICIKVNEDLTYPVPPLSGAFLSLFDLEDYKKLRRANEKIGSYKLLSQKLPMNKDGERVNDFLIDYDTMMTFHNTAEGVLPEEIAMITSPMDLEAIDFSSNVNADRDNVGMAERDYFSTIGVSQMLFNTAQSSSIGLNMSVKTDEQMAFALLRQFERWLNRRLKAEVGSGLRFKVRMLNITQFNQDAFFEKALKASQFGYAGARTMVAASLGMSPSAMVNMAFLENDILNLQDSMIPVQSTHVQTGDESDEGGAPTKKAEDLKSDESVDTRDQEKNQS